MGSLSLFAAVGAYPFPKDDSRRRLKTIRRTAARMQQESNSFLIYFPEGKLHPPESGILPFDTDALRRFDHIFPDKYWWPVHIHMTTWGETLPTLLLAGGTPHRNATGDEVDVLKEGLSTLRTTSQSCGITILEGEKSDDETWDMGFMAQWFERYL